jgi:hypothetical protein
VVPAQHFDTTQERNDKLLAKAGKLAVADAPTERATIEGEQSGGDEFGNTWSETWSRDPETQARCGSKSGADGSGATWSEQWTLQEDGTFELTGENSQGHAWGERAGAFSNGTKYRQKWLEKVEEGYAESTTWWSDGTILGERSGRGDGGDGWVESWRQVLEDGVEKGQLSGHNLAVCACPSRAHTRHSTPHAHASVVGCATVMRCATVVGSGVAS